MTAPIEDTNPAVAPDAALPDAPVGAPPPGGPSLARSSAVVAVGTALSRLTGFVRLAATAYAIGFDRLTDTYTLANTTPNIIYELLLGGVLSATLVPVFVQQADEGDDEGTGAVVSVSAALLVGATVVGLLAAPLLVRLYTLGVDGDVASDQQEVATSMLRLFMPQMLFFGLFAMGTAVLNSRRRFVAASFAPIINNVLVTAVLLALPRLNDGETPTLDDVRDDPVLLLTLGLGTTLGIVAMTAALWPALKRTGLRLKANLDWHHPAVRHVGRLSGWTLGYVLLNQVSLLVVLILANRDPGGVSAYTAAFVFFQLPHALWAVSLMTTLGPELAAAAGRGDNAHFCERFSRGLRLIGLLILPAATGYVVLASPIVTALLERGALEAEAADLAAETLAAFGAGLFGFSAYLFALRGFYSLRDTRTPFAINIGQNAAQIVLAMALEPILGVPGLAFAYGIAYSGGALAALAVLARRVGSLDGARSLDSLLRVLGACAAMAAAVVLVAGRVGGDHGLGALVRMTVGVALGGAVFLVVAFLLRVEELRSVGSRVLRR